MIEKVNIQDSYKFYKEKSQFPTVSLKIYMKITTGFMKFLANKILDGFQVQLSNAHSLGVLAAVGRKPTIRIKEDGTIRGLAVNWKETNLLWASNPELRGTDFVYYTNDHTNGVKYNLVWWKTDMKIGNKYLYSFTFCKPMKRALSEKLFQGKEYLVHT